ncbi:ATP-binding protein [Patescibacteria group bacterium]|nr:ATP-binding protein [Patescibacteria group bacterium]
MIIFQTARIKLTLWYVLIIAIIMSLFSFGFYQVSTRELQRIINRMEMDQKIQESGLAVRLPMQRVFGTTPLYSPTIEELKNLRRKSIVSLLSINSLILVLSGIASYFLAGQTLKPIQKMVNEQNDFISNASHELRTPLAVLRAELESQLLEKNINDKAARHLISSNLEEVSTLQSLTDQLLQLAQVGVLEKIELEKVSLKKAVTTAIKKTNSLAKKKNISFKISQIDSQLNANFDYLVETLIILIDNAIKYSNSDSTIKISVKQTDTQTKISISDNGIGINQDDLEHIFERFYRADKSRSATNGYGLGLAIAKKLMKAQDADINISSKENIGTVVTLVFPS